MIKPSPYISRDVSSPSGDYSPLLWHFPTPLCIFSCVDVCLLLWSYEFIRGKNHVFLIYLSPWGLALCLRIESPQSLFIEPGKGSQFKKTRDEGRKRERALLSNEISSTPLVCPWSKLLFPGQQDQQRGERLPGSVMTANSSVLPRLGFVLKYDRAIM